MHLIRSVKFSWHRIICRLFVKWARPDLEILCGESASSQKTKYLMPLPQTLSVQFSSVHFSSIRFNSIQFNSAVQFNSIQFSSIQFSPIQFTSIQFNSVQFKSAVQFNSVHFSSVQFSSVLNNSLVPFCFLFAWMFVYALKTKNTRTQNALGNHKGNMCFVYKLRNNF